MGGKFYYTVDCASDRGQFFCDTDAEMLMRDLFAVAHHQTFLVSILA